MYVAVKLLGLLHLGYAAEVCYPPYGCFSDDAPFDEALVQLPWSPKDLDTKFLLFNRTFIQQPGGFLDPEDLSSPSKVGFNPQKKTIVFTHGYIESVNRWWVRPLMIELLKHEDVNLVYVEWKNGAAFPYHQAVGNCRLVGAQVARMLEVIRNDTGIDWSSLHLIGFSLGSHVMGYAGKILREKGLLLPRISAVDPASPYFENKHIDRRIDPTDARFIDVIHSDSKTLVVNGFGTVQLMGHVDFYPNGGYDQPGCWKFDQSILQYLACSHYRSMRYYIESINGPCPYYGYPCKNYSEFKAGKCSKCPPKGCPRMGYHATKPSKKHSLNGYKYYMKTHGEESFCAYHYHVTFFTGDGLFNDLNGEVTLTLTGRNASQMFHLEKRYYKQGGTDTTVLTTKKDLGALLSVKIHHNRLIDIWYLRGVTIKPMWTTNQTYTACFNRWLNKADNVVDLKLGGKFPCK